MYVNYLLGAVALIYILYRQVQKRAVRTDNRILVFAILGVAGILQFAQFIGDHHSGLTAISVVVGGLLIGVVFGVLRAYTVRIWNEDGQFWRQGNWLTVLLWLVSIGLHIGIEFVFDADVRGLSGASILLFIAVSFGVQRVVVGARTTKLVGAP